MKSLAPTVPRDLETIIEKAIAREPAHRYATAAALGDDLKRFVEDKAIKARRTSRAERLVRWCRHKGGWPRFFRRSRCSWFSSPSARPSRRFVSTENAIAVATPTSKIGARSTVRRSISRIAAWEDAQIGQVEEILATEPCIRGGPDEPDLRGWEWHYLSRLCHRDALTLTDTETELFSVAFSPRRQLAGGRRMGRQGSVLESDVGGPGPCHPVRSCGRGAPGCLQSRWRNPSVRRQRRQGVVLGCQDGPKTGFRFSDTRRMRSVAFSPNGRQIAAAAWDHLIYVWNRDDHRPPRTFAGHRAPVLNVAFSPDGRQLASCGQDFTARLWDVESGKHLQTFSGHTHQVTGLAFSPDARTLATSSEDETVHLWDAHTGMSRAVMRGHAAWVYSVAFSPDGRRLASAGDDRTVRIWDIDTGLEVLKFRGHVDVARGMAFHSAGRYLASSGGAGRSSSGIWPVAGRIFGCCAGIPFPSRVWGSAPAAGFWLPPARTGICVSGTLPVDAPPSSCKATKPP